MLPALLRVHTPLNVGAWVQALSTHPDRAFAHYVCQGLQFGFRIGFNSSTCRKSATANMGSTSPQPTVLSEYITKELVLGRMLGPLELATRPHVHVSGFGVIFKGHNTGKWKLITDLCYPKGRSVNDGIDPGLCSLLYSTVDEVAELVARLGQGTKVDIKSAYRLIPVHPDDRSLLAVQWEGQIYIDLMLPFGLRSAPKIFNAVADALNWYLHQSGIPLIRHFLDDFIIVAPPGSQQCQEAMSILDRTCCELGVPIADHKREGPSTCLTYLGIEVNTLAGQLRLPSDKLCRVRTLLQEWGGRRTCLWKELESLISLHNHACKVVQSGCAFLRRRIDLLHAVNRPHNSPLPICLNQEFKADLAWWHSFL